MNHLRGNGTADYNLEPKGLSDFIESCNIDLELKDLEPKKESNYKHHLISGIIVIIILGLIFVGIT